MVEELRRHVTDIMFRDNPSLLVDHQLSSYNAFVGGGIQRVFREKNPIRLMKELDKDSGVFMNRCELFLGGRDGTKVYFGRPVIAGESGPSYLYPNIARLRSLSYSTTVHVDVEAVFHSQGKEDATDVVLHKVLLGKFPIMLMSDLCVLKDLAPAIRFEMGEDLAERGGYFIVDGSEKVIVSQEKFADNMLYVRKMSADKYDFAADVRSVSENAAKPVRVVSVRMVAPTPSSTNKQIVVVIANVRKPIPLFIVMRALGILSDKEIIEFCLLDLEEYKSYIDLFIPSVHDAGPIFTQLTALKFIASFTKHKTIPHAMELLSDYFLAHVGELNFRLKAYYLGHMVRELLRVTIGDEAPTDRDSFLYKRVELPGELLTGLFKEYLNKQYKAIYQRIDKEYTYKAQIYKNDFASLVEKNVAMIFSDRIVEEGFRKAFKGNWGSTPATKKLGIVQTLNRLSFNSAISHLRKVNLTFDSGSKITGPRLLHSSQWGLIDPIDTPDGGNVGLHKHMAIATRVSVECSGSSLVQWGTRNGMVSPVFQLPSFLAKAIKVFVNGGWVGSILDPVAFTQSFRVARRSSLIPPMVSISWYIGKRTIHIFTDGGRLCRPLYWRYGAGDGSVLSREIADRILSGKITWQELIGGTGRHEGSPEQCYWGDPTKIYGTDDLAALHKMSGAIDMLDTNEEENALIAFAEDDLTARHTHVEVDPSYLLGVMGNQVVFPENNPLPRDLFACGQMRQAVSVYHSNYQNRIDKMGVVLNNGQTPLVKSRYLKHISGEKHPYGENVICAIMCYGGYNVEDSILFNKGSLDRGMFRTTYYNSYYTREEKAVGKSSEESRIGPIVGAEVVGTRQGYDYTGLGENGLIEEGTALTERTVLIGKRIFAGQGLPDTDGSVVPKKGQTGYVDRAFITEGEEGERIAKVRVRDERIPAIGDKFCSRCGQKGTIGLVIQEENMPYTADGIRPDIIINPHALPSRMTIGQLVEALMGKACLNLGGFGDCTAFANKGQKATKFGEVLSGLGYASSGNELLYNGETGEQLEMSIFIGPTYYMRLKHMVKDKMNHRSKGPRTLLTRQTVQGRANEGGLRVGEMERDAIAAHGVMHFLQESMLVRGDQYYMAICNKTGTIAVYNETYNLFLSPSADGPIKFEGTVDDGLNVINVSKHGRSFSIVRVPYAFKLLMQELSAMNVQMRLITDDNVNCLDDFASQTAVLDASILSTAVSEGQQLTASLEEAADIVEKDATIAKEGIAAVAEDALAATTGVLTGWANTIMGVPTPGTTQLQAVSVQQPAASVQQPAASVQQPAASVQQPAASVQQPAASVQQPAASVQQPAASVQQPAASVQQPTASVQQPAASVPAGVLSSASLQPAASVQPEAQKEAERVEITIRDLREPASKADETVVSEPKAPETGLEDMIKGATDMYEEGLKLTKPSSETKVVTVKKEDLK